MLDGPIGTELAEKFAGVGIVPLGWWDNGIRHTTNARSRSTRRPTSPGLSIRTPADPMTIDIFQALGAATQQIPFSELYVALQQGVVDGQENPLANIASAKLYEVNKFISLSGHKWECDAFPDVADSPWRTSRRRAARVDARRPPRRPPTCSAS